MATTREEMKKYAPSAAAKLYESMKEKVEGVLQNTELQAGLDSILSAMDPIKPFTTTRLLRNLIDAPTIEHFIYSIICLLELHGKWLPSKDQISSDAFTEAWRFFQWVRRKREGLFGQQEQSTSGQQDNDTTEVMEAQAFIRKEEPSPGLTRLCHTMGLDVNEQVGLFEKLELPIFILSGLLGVLSIFCGDKLLSLVFAPKTIANNLARTAKMLKDINVSWSFLEKEIEIFMDFVASFFGMQYISDKSLAAKRTMDLIFTMRDKFTELRGTIKNNLTAIIQSETGVQELERDISKLEQEIDKMHRDGINTSVHHGYLAQFQRQIKEIREVIHDTKSSIAGKQHPVVIYIAGAAGLGKSRLAKHIIKQLSDLEGRPLSVYPRNSAADKYWSGYLHQDVVLYDDFGQDQENVDHIEMIGIYTGAAYKLNLADSPDKGRPFTSRYVICCSNQPYVMKSKAVNDIYALYRRRDWLYYVTCDDILRYQEEHGTLPPEDSPIWRQDFSHLKIDLWRSLPSQEEHEAAQLLEENVDIGRIVQQAYERQVKMNEEYLAEIQQAQESRALFEERRRTLQEFEEEVPEVNIEVAQLEPDEMAPQSVVTEVSGCNQFLLLGPSGTGKSRLLNDKLKFVKVFNLSSIVDSSNNLIIPKNANLHMEDISVTEDATNRALEVCQFLYDNKVFEGNIVYTGNPTMLLKNLMKRGEEARELLYRRCKVINIKRRNNISTLVWGINATKLKDSPGYTWDDLYYVEFENKSLRLSELELLILKNERTIVTYATLDEAAIQDCSHNIVHLHLPDLTFRNFSTMPDRADMAAYLTTASALKALKHLRSFESPFLMLPRMNCSPAHLINTINREQIRLPETTPSCCLNCKDFKLYLINHKTYFLAYIKTETATIPELNFTPPEVKRDPQALNYLTMLKQLATLIAGGVLITRELFGMNQGTPAIQKETPINEPESRKTTQIKKNSKIARSQVSRAKKDDPSPGTSMGKRKTLGMLQNESRVKYDLAPKAESKPKIFTDLKQREEAPEFKNQYDVKTNSKYHPIHYDHIYNHYKSGTPFITLFKEFDIHVSAEELDPSFFYNDLLFEGLDSDREEFYNIFLQSWKCEFLQPEAMQDQQAAQLIPLVENNQVFVYNGSTMVQRALMVHGRIGITTAHGLENHCTIVIPKSNIHYTIRILETKIEKDLAIFEVSKDCPSFRDIRKFIRSIEDTENLDGCDACFVTVHRRKDNVLVSQIRATKVETRKEVRYNQRKIFGYYYAGTVTGFDLPLPSLTDKGFCGSPGIILNTKFQRKIISIHSAGSEYNAFGLPIYQEMFTKNQMQPESVKVDTIELKEYNELTEVTPYKIDEFTVRYELNHNNSAPVKTDIFKSPLNSDMFGNNFEPAILATYDTRNIDSVDIQHVTIEKWSHPQPENVDLEILDYCAESWGDYFANIIASNNMKQFKLTKTEAINRTTFYGSSQPINKDTSCGYPWKHRAGSAGKKLYIQPRQHKTAILNCFTDDQNGRDLNHAIDTLINTCRQGKRPAVVFSSSAKDEVLKKSKIYPCRTRGFTGSPLEYYVAMRQYFHTAICGLIETRKKHPIKLGIEANKEEWNDLYQWMAANSTVGCDIDFKDWDAKVPRVFMEKLPYIYNRIYSACPTEGTNLEEDNRVREGLYKALAGPLLTLGQLVVQAPGGQVSGQPNTTPDNCLVQLMFHLYAWMKLAPEEMKTFSCFLENVRSAVFGDDGMITIKPEVLSFFNFKTIKLVLETDLNLEVTMAAKDGKDVEFKNLHELEFLKRTFIKIGPYWYGKIQQTVLDKMLNWTHTNKRHHYFKEPNKIHFDLMTIESSLDSMLYELCVYPPEDYKKVVEHCQPILARLGSKKILPSQRDALTLRGIPHKLFLSQYKQ